MKQIYDFVSQTKRQNMHNFMHQWLHFAGHLESSECELRSDVKVLFN